MLASLIRTIVPLVVGWLLSQPIVASTGVTKAALTTAVVAVVTALYYLAARLLEQYVTPKFGWLLGLAKAPAYAGKTPFVKGAVAGVTPRADVQVFPPAGG